VLSALASGGAHADVVVSVTRSGSTENQIVIDPAVGGTFPVDLTVDTGGASIVSLEMRLNSIPGGFVTLSGGAYGPHWNPEQDVPPLSPAVIVDKTAVFGSLPATRVLSGVSATAARKLSGVSTVATLTLEIDPQAPPGEYLVNLLDMVAGDLGFQQINPPPRPGADFVVVVANASATVPAVGPVGLLILIFALLGLGATAAARRKAV